MQEHKCVPSISTLLDFLEIRFSTSSIQHGDIPVQVHRFEIDLKTQHGKSHEHRNHDGKEFGQGKQQGQVYTRGENYTSRQRHGYEKHAKMSIYHRSEHARFFGQSVDIGLVLVQQQKRGYSCDRCRLILVRKADTLKHIRVVHDKLKIFPCRIAADALLEGLLHGTNHDFSILCLLIDFWNYVRILTGRFSHIFCPYISNKETWEIAAWHYPSSKQTPSMSAYSEIFLIDSQSPIFSIALIMLSTKSSLLSLWVQILIYCFIWNERLYQWLLESCNLDKSGKQFFYLFNMMLLLTLTYELRSGNLEEGTRGISIQIDLWNTPSSNVKTDFFA